MKELPNPTFPLSLVSLRSLRERMVELGRSPMFERHVCPRLPLRYRKHFPGA